MSDDNRDDLEVTEHPEQNTQRHIDCVSELLKRWAYHLTGPEQEALRYLLDCHYVLTQPKKKVGDVEENTDVTRDARANLRWRCPICKHTMTEQESKNYKGCPTGLHLAKHEPVCSLTGFPRRNQLQLNTAAEMAIRNAISAVESVGAHPLLTDSVILLGEAKEKLSDFIDA